VGHHYSGSPGGYVDNGDWATATVYLLKAHVAHEIGELTKTYLCALAHTSSAATEPGVGASWTTYWLVTTEILDDIRVAYADVDSTKFLCEDEELLYFYYDENEKILNGAARACEKLTAQFSREADFSDGEISVKMSQKAEAYRQMGRMLRDMQTETDEADEKFALAVRVRETDRDPAFTVDQSTYDGERDL
jgi:hypothetical protein